MKDPSLPLQAAIFAALDGSADLKAACRAATSPEQFVFDRIPLGANGKVTATYPFVHIGEDHVVSDADQCHDASTAYATVHVFSQAVGKVEAKTVMAIVCRLLDANLTLTGFEIVTHSVDDGPRYLTEPDGQTSHGVVTFAFKLGPTA